ncbi:hypothetical protein EII29_04825 [Leptotrichia sp. OH3620_COT-345]|uniref:hypothetical protein n=1 Tax=Leptotrichia sp. OH3620_COT-345 TaxID=2491048 RepID=UPI000F65131A|nr:hypothetical protein [Leptotrichia sp. OH3620_COT-345]RRD39849.1 hypothetical protein EII29_04825 [Leptotrichia sp. OH3620_COT-345]
MKLYILPGLLIIIEISFLVYVIARDCNKSFRKVAENMKEKIIEKMKLNLNTETKDFSKRSYLILFGIVGFTLFMDNKMVVVILITVFMIFLLKLRISYEKFEKLFIHYKPSLKKYNIYLSILLLIQTITIILTVLFAG